MPRHANDLHPDDTTNRHRLMRHLFTLREVTTDRATFAKRLSIPTRDVWGFEHEPRPNPMLDGAQRYARALNRRLAPAPVGLPNPNPNDALLAMYARKAATTTDPAEADEWHRAWLLAYLISARTEAGISQARLAPVLGCTEQSIQAIEAGRFNPLLSTYQRHARGIALAAGSPGGYLVLHLTTTNVQAEAA